MADPGWVRLLNTHVHDIGPASTHVIFGDQILEPIGNSVIKITNTGEVYVKEWLARKSASKWNGELVNRGKELKPLSRSDELYDRGEETPTALPDDDLHEAINLLKKAVSILEQLTSGKR